MSPDNTDSEGTRSTSTQNSHSQVKAYTGLMIASIGIYIGYVHPILSTNNLYSNASVVLSVVVIFTGLLITAFWLYLRHGILRSDEHTLDEPIPHNRRNELHHLSSKSTQLAGFSLTLFILLAGFYRNEEKTIFVPGSLLMVSFIFLLAVSQYNWNSRKQWHFIMAEMVHKVGMVVLVLAGYFTFLNIYGQIPTILIIVAVAFLIYTAWDLKKMKDTVDEVLGTDNP